MMTSGVDIKKSSLTIRFSVLGSIPHEALVYRLKPRTVAFAFSDLMIVSTGQAPFHAAVASEPVSDEAAFSRLYTLLHGLGSVDIAEGCTWQKPVCFS